jgi:hypothetical protein
MKDAQSATVALPLFRRSLVFWLVISPPMRLLKWRQGKGRRLERCKVVELFKARRESTGLKILFPTGLLLSEAKPW